MLIECCNQERSYLKFYGLLSQRFCQVGREYQEAFCQAFVEQVSLLLLWRHYHLYPFSFMKYGCSCIYVIHFFKWFLFKWMLTIGTVLTWYSWIPSLSPLSLLRLPSSISFTRTHLYYDAINPSYLFFSMPRCIVWKSTNYDTWLSCLRTYSSRTQCRGT